MRIAICLCLAALAPLAGAAPEAETTDPSLDAFPPTANAWGDVTRARAAVEGDALVLDLELTVLPEAQPGMAYVVLFRAGGREWYGALASAPTPAYYHGDWTGRGPGAQDPAEGAYDAGAPGRVTVRFPLASLPENASRVDRLGAMTVDIRPQLAGASPLVHDEAWGDVDLALPGNATQADAPLARAAVQAAPPPGEAKDAPWGGPLLVLAALAAVALGARQRNQGGT